MRDSLTNFFIDFKLLLRLIVVCNFNKDGNLDRFADECAEIFSHDYVLDFATNDYKFTYDFKNYISISSPRSPFFLQCQN